MPAPSITVQAPPPVNYFDPGTLRPPAQVAWTGTTGPDDVLHEWDTVNTFDSPNLIQDSNTGTSSPDVGVPSADMGPAGTSWFYRVTVTDTDDSESTTSAVFELSWADPIDFRRYLHELGNVSVAFNPTDTTTPGPADANFAADGETIEFRRYLHELASVGVGFAPTDTPAEGWGPAPDEIAPDGETIEFRRYLYELSLVNTDTPTPHIWYLFPTFGREGWEFQIVGYGFGDTQGTFSGSVTLNGLAVGITSWELVAESSPNLTIDPITNVAEPIHQLIRAVVPEDAESGLVIVCTDGP